MVSAPRLDVFRLLQQSVADLKLDPPKRAQALFEEFHDEEASFHDDYTEVNLDLDGALEECVLDEEPTSANLTVWEDGNVPVDFDRGPVPQTRNERQPKKRWQSEVSHLVDDLVDFDAEADAFEDLPELSPDAFHEVPQFPEFKLAKIQLVKSGSHAAPPDPTEGLMLEAVPIVVGQPELPPRRDGWWPKTGTLLQLAATIFCAWALLSGGL